MRKPNRAIKSFRTLSALRRKRLIQSLPESDMNGFVLDFRVRADFWKTAFHSKKSSPLCNSAASFKGKKQNSARVRPILSRCPQNLFQIQSKEAFSLMSKSFYVNISRVQYLRLNILKPVYPFFLICSNCLFESLGQHFPSRN